MKRIFLKSVRLLLSFVTVFVLVGCSTGKLNLTSGDVTEPVKSDVVKREKGKIQYLTATVYNATVSNQENQELIDEENIESLPSDQEFGYDQIQVYKGYSFKTILDFKFEPYFMNDYIDQEIEVIISIFGLHSNRVDAWYEQKMIIFKTDTEMIGFLSPRWGIINEYNPVDLSLKELYFESPMLLTDSEIVKYYNPGDRLYTFSANLSNPEQVILNITSELAFVTEREPLTYTVVPNSLIELEGSQVFNIMEMAEIEKLDIKATIVSIDLENKLLYVTSSDLVTLQTVELCPIYNLEGIELTPQELKIGDEIHISYYKRYSHNSPTHLRVNKIIVDQSVSIE